MCSVPEAVQRQLSESVRVIAESDWPAQWETLLPLLVKRLMDNLQARQFSSFVGLLSTMNELYKRFRGGRPDDNPLMAQLLYALTASQEPLLVLAQSLAGMEINNDNKHVIFASMRLVCRIFFSLNDATIPEFFEDHQKEWFACFERFMNLPLDYFTEYLDDENPGPVEKVQVAILENIRLYSEKYYVEFQPFVQQFVNLTFQILIVKSKLKDPRYDDLVNNGMRFIGTVCTIPDHANVFSMEETLRGILEQIIIPNLDLTSHDIEQFNDNPMEYLRRDIEGGDTETRRRIACELMEKLCRLYDNQVTSLCASYIGQLLQLYTSDPKREWKTKDKAITLVIAVSVRGSTRSEGATKVKDLGTILSFMTAHVLPELQNQGIDDSPIIKADCIKYLATFRTQVPKADVLATVLPMLIRFLDSKSIVVHSYAAQAIDGFLNVREPMPPRPSRLAPSDISPFVQPVLVKLFALINAMTTESNEALMKCVVRVVNVGRQDVGPVVPQVLAQLSLVLARVASNPTNPMFNHYLFESIAALLRFGFESGKVSVEQLEQAVNPTFEKILQNNIGEFMPYVFQIMAQTLRMRQTVPAHFMTIFPSVVAPSMIWEAKANVPALVTLLQAYLVRGANQFIANDPTKLASLLDIFYRLLKMKSTESLAFELMVCICSYCPFAVIIPHLKNIFTASLERLKQPAPSQALGRSFTIFMSILICKQSTQGVYDVIESLEAGLFNKLVGGVWVPAFKKVVLATERKACAVGATKLLCEFPPFFQFCRDAWNVLFVAQVSLLAEVANKLAMDGQENLERDQVNESLEIMAEAGHSTNYQKLQFAQSESDNDSFPEITDPVRYFLERLRMNQVLFQSGQELLGQDNKQQLVKSFTNMLQLR